MNAGSPDAYTAQCSQIRNVDKVARSQLKGQCPAVLWFTGLSGSGKSTIASLVEQALHASGRHTYFLDADQVRQGLNRSLGFTMDDRSENVRRLAEVAKLMVDAGLIVLVACVSPLWAQRAMARSLFGPGEFFEIYVSTPLEVAEARDVKGLYREARQRQLLHFTGIDSAYEVPPNPDMRVDTVGCSPSESAAQVMTALRERGCLAARHAAS